LEISICGPSGQNVSNNVAPQGPGLFLVNFVPVESGQHRANVTFNKENIRGLSEFFSTYVFEVIIFYVHVCVSVCLPLCVTFVCVVS